MQILALLRVVPTAAPDRFAALVRPEAQHVWTLHLAGTLRAIHFLQAPDAPYPMGVSMLLEVADPAQAQTLIAALPMVAAGLVQPELLPLAPFTSYATLFATDPRA
jgi:hypothetical protein